MKVQALFVPYRSCSGLSRWIPAIAYFAVGLYGPFDFIIELLIKARFKIFQKLVDSGVKLPERNCSLGDVEVKDAVQA